MRRPKRGNGAKRRMMEPFDSSCVECGGKGKVVSGLIAKPRLRHLHSRLFLLCDCGAHVACHIGTAVSMGRPAGSETRKLRKQAHDALDAQWRRDGATALGMSKARHRTYAWLARELGMKTSHCHIGMFDAETCRKVIALCAADRRRAA